jgi:hypothetical protein
MRFCRLLMLLQITSEGPQSLGVCVCGGGGGLNVPLEDDKTCDSQIDDGEKQSSWDL